MIVTTRLCDMPEAPVGAGQRQQAQLDREHAGEAQAEPFTLDGRAYEIDLCAAHRRAFRELGEHWAGWGRRVAGGAVKPDRRGVKHGGGRTMAVRARAAAVRAWAREQDWPGVGDRGRMPDEVYPAYDRAHGR